MYVEQNVWSVEAACSRRPGDGWVRNGDRVIIWSWARSSSALALIGEAIKGQ